MRQPEPAKRNCCENFRRFLFFGLVMFCGRLWIEEEDRMGWCAEGRIGESLFKAYQISSASIQIPQWQSRILTDRFKHRV